MPASDGKPLNLFRILTWPLRSFVNARDFTSRVPSAGLSVTIVGEVLKSLGISAGIAGAVSVLGLAAVFTEVGLKVLLRRRDPLNAIGIKDRAAALLVYAGSGFAYFVLRGPGAIDKLGLSATQFVLGLFVTYVTSTVFMITWNQLESENANISTMIIGSMSVSIGMMTMAFVLIQRIMEMTGNGEVLQALTTEPAKINESNVVSTEPS